MHKKNQIEENMVPKHNVKFYDLKVIFYGYFLIKDFSKRENVCFICTNAILITKFRVLVFLIKINCNEYPVHTHLDILLCVNGLKFFIQDCWLLTLKDKILLEKKVLTWFNTISL